MYIRGLWSFWSRFDVNRSTFDEDMREQRFLHFRSQWPWPQMCSPSYFCPALCFKLNLSFYGFPVVFDKIGGSDGRTDGRTGATLNAAPREGRVIKFVYWNAAGRMQSTHKCDCTIKYSKIYKMFISVDVLVQHSVLLTKLWLVKSCCVCCLHAAAACSFKKHLQWVREVGDMAKICMP